MRHVRHRSQASYARHGVTLLELIVVLALVGLLLGIAAPAFVVPSPRPESDAASALTAARRTSLLRGEPVTLLLERDGSWRVVADASTGGAPINTGVVRGWTTPLRIHVSPVGTCIAEPADGADSAPWNVAGCSAAAPTHAARQGR